MSLTQFMMTCEGPALYSTKEGFMVAHSEFSRGDLVEDCSDEALPSPVWVAKIRWETGK